MKNSGRRSGLRTVAEGELASVVGGLAATVLTRVNVIVHGFGLIFGAVKNKAGELQPGVTVMLPDDPAAPMPHKQLVGSFYNKNDVGIPIDRNKAYTFTNLAGAKTFPPVDMSPTARNAVLQPDNITTDGFDGFLRIILPYPFPDSFLSLRCRQRPDRHELITGTDIGLLLTHPTAIAVAHVFSYDVANPQQAVQLLDETGKPVFTVSVDPRVAGATTGNCHIFNEPDMEPDAKHSRDTFKLFRKLLKVAPKTPLQLDFEIDDEHGDLHLLTDVPCKDTPGPGIEVPDDLLTLAERRQHFVSLHGANCLALMLIP